MWRHAKTGILSAGKLLAAGLIFGGQLKRWTTEYWELFEKFGARLISR